MSIQRSADLLIEARWVLPVEPAAALGDHAVAVTDGHIVAVGPSAELAARFAPREHLTRASHVLLPGLVNAHTRAGRTLLRGGAPLGLRMGMAPAAAAPAGAARAASEPAEASWLGADLVRDGTQLAAAAMLRAGITSFGTRDLYPEEVARVAAAARMRVAIGMPVEERANAWAEDLTSHLAKAERLWDTYRSDPWVSLHFAPDDASGLSDATLAHIRTVADELDARIAMPVHETEHEVRDSLARHGASSVRRLHALGLLRPGFTALYLNQLDDSELELLARTGIGVVACPQASLRRGLGSCRVHELLGRGIVVGLGTGGPMAAFTLDVLAEARAAALFTRAITRVPDALSAERVLRLATLGGATALGLGSIVGSIEPGKAADLIAIDVGSIVGESDGSPAEAVVFAATCEDVTDVWINGAPRMTQGRLLAYDEDELLALARRWERRL
ncbi:MAG TPA: amidohydrolase family protein [Steroidobacteraceae bacterium]|nr:amidohydrolase family protein [Steroidobacteraceae bacterium]